MSSAWYRTRLSMAANWETLGIGSKESTKLALLENMEKLESLENVHNNIVVEVFVWLVRKTYKIWQAKQTHCDYDH